MDDQTERDLNGLTVSYTIAKGSGRIWIVSAIIWTIIEKTMDIVMRVRCALHR
jgi:hypothetical protein